MAWVNNKATSPHLGCRPLSECKFFLEYALQCFSMYPYIGVHDRLSRLCNELRPLDQLAANQWLKKHGNDLLPMAGESADRWPAVMSDNVTLQKVVMKTTELIEPVYAHEELRDLTRTMALFQSLRRDRNVFHRFRSSRLSGVIAMGDTGKIADIYALARDEYLETDSGRSGPHNAFDPAACKAIAMKMPTNQKNDYATIASLARLVGANMTRQTAARIVKDLKASA